MSPEIDEHGFDWESMTPATDEAKEAPEQTGRPSELLIEEPPAQEERARDEQGRFLPRPEATPEPEADTPEEAPYPEVGYSPEVEAYLQKYGGDVKAALEAAQHAERDRGRAVQEMGALRQEMAQLRAIQEQAAYGQDDQQFEQQYTEQLEDDPAGAAIAAFERGDEFRFGKAFNAWTEEDPVVARMWADGQMTRLQQQERINQLESMVQPIQAQGQQAQMEGMFRGLVQKYPDITEMLPAINQALEGNRFAHFSAHNAENPMIREQAIEWAYKQAKAEQILADPNRMRELANAQAQASERAQQEAFVASGDTAVREEQQSLVDQLTEGWEHSESHYWGS